MKRLLPLLPTLLFANPSANPEMRDSWEASVTAGYLYLWTEVDGLAYAIKAEGARQKVLNPEILPDNGFKLGVAAYLPHDGWDLAFNLMHLHSRAPIHERGHLSPLWTLPTSTPGGFVDEVEAHWRLHFALLDLELGRSFFLSSRLTMRPHIGLRFAIVRQKYLLHYIGGDLFPGGEDYVSMKSKFIAPGVRMGNDFEWMIGKGFGLYSKSALSILYGLLYAHESEKVSFETQKRTNLFDNFYTSLPIIDLAAGVQWESYLFRSRYHLLLQAGWEMHLLFAQNQLFRYLGLGVVSKSVNGDLGIQGLSLSATFSY